MIPRFALLRARSIAEAVAAVADGDAAYLAGGTELLQVMKMGFAQFATLVDIKGIAELRGINLETDGSLRIGAITTHREIERSPLVAKAAPALVRLAGRIANVRVRNTGTIGGNLAFAEPHSDPATFLLVCDAKVTLAGAAHRRTLPVGAFITGPLTTARQPEEILVDIRLRPRRPGEGYAYEKLAFFERPAAAVAVRLRVEGAEIVEAAVAVGSAVDTPTLVDAAGQRLIGLPARPDVSPVGLAGDGLFDNLEIADDLNGSPEYKRHLLGVLFRRAALAALQEANSDG
jgi:carbon-monoxide dehydrogenase medium subunit